MRKFDVLCFLFVCATLSATAFIGCTNNSRSGSPGSEADTIMVQCVDASKDTTWYVATTGSMYWGTNGIKFTDNITHKTHYVLNKSCDWQNK